MTKAMCESLSPLLKNNKHSDESYSPHFAVYLCITTIGHCFHLETYKYL